MSACHNWMLLGSASELIIRAEQPSCARTCRVVNKGRLSLVVPYFSLASRFLRRLILGALFGMGVAYAAPLAYIPNNFSNDVSVVDTATNAVVATVRASLTLHQTWRALRLSYPGVEWAGAWCCASNRYWAACITNIRWCPHSAN
jgi:YVTN family beta-propeller protein